MLYCGSNAVPLFSLCSQRCVGGAEKHLLLSTNRHDCHALGPVSFEALVGKDVQRFHLSSFVPLEHDCRVLAGVTDDSMIWRWDRSFHIKQEPDAASEKAGEAAASAASPAAATTLKTDGAAASATRKDGTG